MTKSCNLDRKKTKPKTPLLISVASAIRWSKVKQATVIRRIQQSRPLKN